MKQCKCKNKTFDSIFSTQVTFTLDESETLTATEEKNIGNDGVFICSKCSEEYSPSDFYQIIIK